MADTTPPLITITNVDRTKISDEPGFQVAQITWQANEDIFEYIVRIGGLDYTTGTLVEHKEPPKWFPIFPLDLSDGRIPAGTQITTVVSYTLLNEGDNQINIYARDAAGNWVPYMQQ